VSRTLGDYAAVPATVTGFVFGTSLTDGRGSEKQGEPLLPSPGRKVSDEHACLSRFDVVECDAGVVAF
jgi:hypothetical protein